MKKTNLIIIIVLILLFAFGLAAVLTSADECKEKNEEQCKRDKTCLSVLVPCTDQTCTSDAVFKECKDKE